MQQQHTEKASSSPSTQQGSQQGFTSEASANSSTLVQRARVDPNSLTPTGVMALQRMIGNRATAQLLTQAREAESSSPAVAAATKRRDEEEAESAAGGTGKPVVEPPLRPAKSNGRTPDDPIKRSYSPPALSSHRKEPLIQRLREPLQPPKKEDIDFTDSGTFNDIGNTQAIPFQNTGKAKDRAGTVDALLLPSSYATGSVPSVDPLGWDYVTQVAVQKQNKKTQAHKGWVRFHLLNNLLGGVGNDERNLVPTLSIYNSSQAWQKQFEETAKAYLSPQNSSFPHLNPTNTAHALTFEVNVAYHANVVSNPKKAGDNQMEKFPSQIDAQFKYFDATSAKWKDPKNYGTVTIAIPAPSLTPGDAEYALTDCSAQTLVDIFKIDKWLANRVLDESGAVLAGLKSKKINSVQALYDTLADNILFAMFTNLSHGTPQDTLDAHWPRLEDALIKTSGKSLRLYVGWIPTGQKAVTMPARTFNLGRLVSAAKDINGMSAKQLKFRLHLDATALSSFAAIKNPSDVKDAKELYDQLVPTGNRPIDYTNFDQNIWPQIANQIGPNPQIYLLDLKKVPVLTKSEYFAKANLEWKKLNSNRDMLSQKLVSEAARKLFQEKAKAIIDKLAQKLIGEFKAVKDIEWNAQNADKELSSAFDPASKKDQVEQAIHAKINSLTQQYGPMSGDASTRFDAHRKQLIEKLYADQSWFVSSFDYTNPLETTYPELNVKGKLETALRQEVQNRSNINNPSNEQTQAILQFQQWSADLYPKVYDHHSLKSDNELLKYVNFYNEKLDAYEAKAAANAVTQNIRLALTNRAQQLQANNVSQDTNVANSLEHEAKGGKLLDHIKTHVPSLAQIPTMVTHYQNQIANVEAYYRNRLRNQVEERKQEEEPHNPRNVKRRKEGNM